MYDSSTPQITVSRAFSVVISKPAEIGAWMCIGKFVPPFPSSIQPISVLMLKPADTHGIRVTEPLSIRRGSWNLSEKGKIRFLTRIVPPDSFGDVLNESS